MASLAFALRGNLRRRKGLLDYALEDFNNALDLNPYSENAFLERASAYLEIGEVEAGLRDLTTAIGLNPRYKGGTATCLYEVILSALCC